MDHDSSVRLSYGSDCPSSSYYGRGGGVVAPHPQHESQHSLLRDCIGASTPSRQYMGGQEVEEDHRLVAIAEELAAAIERYRVIRLEGGHSGGDEVSEEEVAMLLEHVMGGGPPDWNDHEHDAYSVEGMPTDDAGGQCRSSPHKYVASLRVDPQSPSASYSDHQQSHCRTRPRLPLAPHHGRSIQSSFRDRVRIVFYDTVRVRGAEQNTGTAGNGNGPAHKGVDGLNESPPQRTREGCSGFYYAGAGKSHAAAPPICGDSPTFITLRVEVIFITNPKRDDLVRFDGMLRHQSGAQQQQRCNGPFSPSLPPLSSLLPRPILYVNIASSARDDYNHSHLKGGGRGAFSEEHSDAEFQVIFSNAVFLASSTTTNSTTPSLHQQPRFLGKEGSGRPHSDDADADTSDEGRVHALIEALGGCDGGGGQTDDTATDAALPTLFIPPERNNTIGAGGTAHLFYPQEVVETTRGWSKRTVVATPPHQGVGDHYYDDGSGDGAGGVFYDGSLPPTATTIEEIKTVITTARQSNGGGGGEGSSGGGGGHDGSFLSSTAYRHPLSSSAYTRRQETITQRTVTVGDAVGVMMRGATNSNHNAGAGRRGATPQREHATTVRRVFPMASLLGRIGTMGLVGGTSSACSDLDAGLFPPEGVGHLRQRAGGFTPLKLLLMDHHRAQGSLPMGSDEGVVSMRGRPQLSSTTAALPFTAAEEDSLAPPRAEGAIGSIICNRSGGGGGGAGAVDAHHDHREVPLLLSHMDALLGDRKGLSPGSSLGLGTNSSVGECNHHGTPAAIAVGGSALYATIPSTTNSGSDSLMLSSRHGGVCTMEVGRSRSGGGGSGTWRNDPRGAKALMEMAPQHHSSGEAGVGDDGSVPSHHYASSFFIADSREPLSMRVNARSRAVVHGIANIALVLAANTI